MSDRDHFLDYLTFCKIPLVGGMMAERLTPGRPGSSLCFASRCFLGQETLLHFVSSLRCINGTHVRYTAGGNEIFLVALVFENQDDLQLDGPLECRRFPPYLSKLPLDILSVPLVGCMYCATQSIQETFSR